MKFVYIAGPYRASSEYQVLQNIRRAEDLALKVWKAGCACICPHKNAAFLGGAAPDSVWLQGGLEMIRRCDAIILVDGWRHSEGTRAEIKEARDLGVPVFVDFENFEKWLTNNA